MNVDILPTGRGRYIGDGHDTSAPTAGCYVLVLVAEIPPGQAQGPYISRKDVASKRA
ncbi:MAG: hypothetical protein ABI465_12000 [Ktedonobacteraceae bacterium]